MFDSRTYWWGTPLTKAINCGADDSEYDPSNDDYYRFIPEKTMRVRVHVMQDINGANNFQDDFIGNDIIFAMIDLANQKYTSPDAMHLYSGAVPPPVYPTKLRYELTPDPDDADDPDQNGITFHKTNDEWWKFPNDGCYTGSCATRGICLETGIDSVEVLTGIDFFPKLPNRIEKKIESEVNLSKWHLD